MQVQAAEAAQAAMQSKLDQTEATLNLVSAMAHATSTSIQVFGFVKSRGM